MCDIEPKHVIDVDNLSDLVIIYGPDGTVIFVSNYINELLGYSKEDVIGSNIYDYFLKYLDQKTIEKIENTTKEKALATVQHRLRRKDGKYIWAETSIRRVNNEDGSVKETTCIIRNISKRIEAEQELAKSNASFKTIFDYAGMGIILLDSKGTPVKVNKACYDIVGYSPDDDFSVMDVVPRGFIETFRKALEELDADKNRMTRTEIPLRTKSGEMKYVDVISTLIPARESIDMSIILIINDITVLKKCEEKLILDKQIAEERATTDYLTDIMNRRAFMERFSEELHRAKREKTPVSIIMADIDRFKRINDTYGHQMGDMVLKAFARCLKKACRPYDFIGRYGGEEFIMCLPNTNINQAEKVAERIKSAVENLDIRTVYQSEPVSITASFGVASPTTIEDYDTDSLLILADDAMYKAKFSGRNRVCL